jgi:nucleoid-associated protein YgaU
MARPNRSDRSNLIRGDFSTALLEPEGETMTLDPISGMDFDATDRMYVVEEGDTLTSIARKFYGNAAARRRIHVANSRVIRDPLVIEPGWRLRIPY